MDGSGISVVLPARNEAASLETLLPRIRSVVPGAEVIVVDDGSTDATAGVAQAAGARVVSHPIAMGNGAAIKSGARAATRETLVLMDADGQHPPEAIPSLLEQLGRGFGMAVGSRSRSGQASAGRAIANGFYNRFASWITGYAIRDLTSGFRAASTARFREFLALLPNRFSYPTTITMAFLKMGYGIAYVPVDVAQRIGTSHIRPFRDGIRFLLIIFRIATLFSPLKLFVPAAALCWLLGFGNYARTYLAEGRFTNMSALLLLAGLLILFAGLLAEQVCMATYVALTARQPAPPGEAAEASRRP
ncbi:MAG TPA: glycosyltransferase family 2 protein [Xanthomonadales bacterium]|nr:glycosyltransferase family 2 protein [Xanthomonadales bacterium]